MRDEIAHSLRAEGFDASEDGTGRGTPLVPCVVHAIQGAATRENPNSGPDGVGARSDGCAYTLESRTEVQAVAYGFQPRIARNGRGDMGDVVSALSAQAGETGKGDSAPCVAFDTCATLDARATGGGFPGSDGAMGGHVVPAQYAVRRLTPTECERLQGFPDGWTDVPYRNKPAADGPRYKALGNSMAVNCMAWIGQRIQMVEDILRESPSVPDP